MSNYSDILSIERYLRGELDEQARHIFERAALNDPFLADAVDGYSSRESQLGNLDILKQRLKIRAGFDEEEKRPFNLRLLIVTIIAVIGFALVAAWYILVHIPQQKAKTSQPPAIIIGTIKTDLQTGMPKARQRTGGIMADTTKKDSAEKKKDTLNKKTAAAIRKTDTVLTPTANAVQQTVAPARRHADPHNVGSTVHPSTVIADLNRLPYGSRKKAMPGQPALQKVDIPQDGELAPKDKPLNAGAGVSKPLTGSASPQNLQGISAPAENKVKLEGAKKQSPTSLQQLMQKHTPTTVIIPPPNNAVVATTAPVQKTASPAVVLSNVPAVVGKPESISVAEKNKNTRQVKPDAGTTGARVVNAAPASAMRGRDISMIGGGAKPIKKNDIGQNDGPSAKDDANNRDSGTLSATGKSKSLDTLNGITGPAGIDKRNITSEVKTPSGKNRIPVLLNGRVVSILTGKPVAQVVMWNKTENIQHRLEADGEFDIVAHKGDDIYVGRSGYKTQKVKVRNRKRFDIILEEKNSSLYDGYVRGLNFTPFDDQAHPAIGWDKLKPFQKLKAADGKTGTIRIVFTVNRDNSVSDIQIQNGVSATADTQAVQVIRNRVKWVHNTNNQPETITLKFKVE